MVSVIRSRKGMNLIISAGTGESLRLMTGSGIYLPSSKGLMGDLMLTTTIQVTALEEMVIWPKNVKGLRDVRKLLNTGRLNILN